MIHVQCPKCEDYISVQESAGGEKLRCPNCGNIVRAPESREVSGRASKSSGAGLALGFVVLGWMIGLGAVQASAYGKGMFAAGIAGLTGSVGLLGAVLHLLSTKGHVGSDGRSTAWAAVVLFVFLAIMLAMIAGK